MNPEPQATTPPRQRQPSFTWRLLLLGVLTGALGACTLVPSAQQIKQARAFYNIGVTEASKGRYRRAIASFLRAGQLNPYDYKIHEATGGTFLRMGMPKKAVRHYRKAIDVRPKHPHGWNNLAAAYTAMGQWQKAANAYHKSLKNIMYQTPCYSQLGLGWVYHKMKKYPEAKKYFGLSLQTCPRLCQGYRMYGLAMMEQKQYTDAQKGFQELTKRCKKYAVGYIFLARSYVAQKHHHAALSPLRECIRLSKKSRHAQLLRSCRTMLAKTQRQIAGSP